MLHSIPTQNLGPHGEEMADAVSACVHCGFCLAACPTYQELSQEMDTPRGRIVLMKEVLEGKLSWAEANPHLDRCLGCLACEPACPSGVAYRDLISPFRALASSHLRRSPLDRLRRWIISQTLPFPRRLRWALRAASLVQPLAGMLPKIFQPFLELLPERLPPARPQKSHHPAQEPQRARVALLTGCAQQVLEPDINAATIEVLTREGVEVFLPKEQGCCGALAWHTGDLDAARNFARQNLDAFTGEFDAILTNAAGCGSALQEYALILKGTPDEEKARYLASSSMDVSAFLQELGMRNTPAPSSLRVAYQDACHLANAQGIRQAPRELLGQIPGLKLLELPQSNLCCGSAGSYNLDQPEIAASLGEQKARAILKSGADLVATGNIGCLTQMRHHLQKLKSSIEVRHTMQVIRDACR